jgi:Raf kinase inhibitor-like YbhB/YbcL family protein
MRGATLTGSAAAVAAIVATAGCSGGGERADPPTSGASVITVTSTAFDDGQQIPPKYTCDGAGVSPALAWSGISPDAQALALVVDDPDAPGGGTFVHWVVANIDPGSEGVQEGAVPDAGVQVVNSSGNASYSGPCPPSGTHHYRFTVYALSSRVDVAADTDLDTVFRAIDGASTGRGALTGTYARQ